MGITIGAAVAQFVNFRARFVLDRGLLGRTAHLSLFSVVGGGNAQPATSDSEEGLKWDVITQVGALLKSNAPSRPLAGFNVQYLYMTSQDAAQTTYINAIGPHASAGSANKEANNTTIRVRIFIGDTPFGCFGHYVRPRFECRDKFSLILPVRIL